VRAEEVPRGAFGVQGAAKGVVHEQGAGAGGRGASARQFNRHSVDILPKVGLPVLAILCAQRSGIHRHDAVVVTDPVPRGTRTEFPFITRENCVGYEGWAAAGVRGGGGGGAAKEALGVVTDVVIAGDEPLAWFWRENAAESTELEVKTAGGARRWGRERDLRRWYKRRGKHRGLGQW
jgi:hypothetical protein